ncbi:hypothetical protein ACKLKD_00765 [Klebsiella sp. 10982]|jgi:hypothetical protein|nr:MULTISPECIES: hypothetical protein [Klebsiella]MCL7685051.1 hypothetical protein [Klebsiella quasivariicola]MEA1150229.1 hypothetical protein [Klebsiella pneumoniae]
MAGGDKNAERNNVPYIHWGHKRDFILTGESVMLKSLLTGLFFIYFLAGNAYAEDYNDIFWGMLKKENQEIFLSVATARH